MCLVYTLICVKVADIKAHVQVHRSQVHRSYVPGSAGGMFSAWRVGFKSAVFFAVLYARVVAMLTLPLHFSLLPLSPLCVDHFHFASAPPTPSRPLSSCTYPCIICLLCRSSPFVCSVCALRTGNFRAPGYGQDVRFEYECEAGFVRHEDSAGTL